MTEFMSSIVFLAANLAAILDFELRYTKMLKGARVASNGFLIRTSESIDFTQKNLGCGTPSPGSPNILLDYDGYAQAD